MAGRIGSPPLLLGSAATVAVGGALVADAALGEHPTHSVVLGVVVVVVAALRWLGCVAVTAFPAVFTALAAQPVLHLTSELARPQTVAEVAHDHWDLQHLVVSEVPTAGVQIAIPALALVAITIAAHLLYLLIDAVRPPPATLSAPRAPHRVFLPIHPRRLGSMLRWCGWVLQAARRGPPPSGHAVS
jgi:hypothetical protein